MVKERRIHRFLARVLPMLLIASVLTLAPSTGVAPAQTAAAAEASKWDPGYIIDDRIFYDSNAMSAAEIQNFLNSQVPNCRAGYTCLKGYGQPTSSIAADRYCDGFPATGRLSSAQIIDIAARSCGLSQRVLLVLLQKEQSLVTSTAPSQRQFDAATGQSCPDTAPCDPAYSGFFYQVYYAARQYEVYRLNPTLFGYQAGRWNNILYHPNRACGTTRVYIANQATAALYIYTPYTPNAAALANMYGTGDGCSSYGNRNFWRIFTDWFGDPQRYETHPGFVWYWNATGGASGALGQPTSYLFRADENGGGYYQRFQNGTLYTSGIGTAFVPNNPFGGKYGGESGPAGSLSWPTSEVMCAANGTCFQNFDGGTLTVGQGAGVFAIRGGIATWWQQNAVHTLGAALEDSRYVTANGTAGWTQRFVGGTYAISSVGQFTSSAGSLRDLWDRSGGPSGGYGWPTTAYACVGASCAQSFQHATLSSTPQWGAHAILWGFESRWKQLGGLAGPGAALDDLRSSSARGGGWIQQFANFAIIETATSSVTMPYNSIYQLWNSTGKEGGYLGWPTGTLACQGSACAQRFQDTLLTSQPSTGAIPVIGGFVGGWETAGGLTGPGAAVSYLRASTYNGGGWIQQFANGTISQRAGIAPVYTPSSPILSTWYYYGGEATWLGWPASAPVCDANGCVQQFQYGVGRSNSSGYVTFSPN